MPPRMGRIDWCCMPFLPGEVSRFMMQRLKVSRTPKKSPALKKHQNGGFFTLGLSHFCWSATLKAEKTTSCAHKIPQSHHLLESSPLKKVILLDYNHLTLYRTEGLGTIIILRVLISILPVSLVEIKDYNWTSHVQASKQASRKWPVYTKKPPQIPQVKERSSPWPWSIKTFS